MNRRRPGPSFNHGRSSGPFGQMMGPQQRAKQGGGLLSKIFGRGNQNTGYPGAPGGGFFVVGGQTRSPAATTGSSFLKTLTNPATINGFLNNTQQILNAMQSFGPIVQQYGPLVKNFPAMLKLYKGLKDAPENDGDHAKKTKKDRSRKRSVLESESESWDDLESESESLQDQEDVPLRRPKNGNSVPKIFF
ncbi:hypothetical protein CVD25_04180 [Bacillus canaveralius]|uniref:YqfQ-like protein n=2 Tax=Bacillaceae TaxID=186817 RepID=A0A2N5GRT1_9BACI|nr:hypothetical protein CU635_02470 [Bacillus canaveralius]PLR87696.1 hypothetical protein CVD23_01730 [Bacillus sp. V33-4]PLS00273.1 hypothetical protein CVD25_04180 [Bacillus canaveralius]RSK56291.1 hypothetical protein EJA13_02370 [Bacillus canaveralius]